MEHIHIHAKGIFKLSTANFRGMPPRRESRKTPSFRQVWRTIINRGFRVDDDKRRQDTPISPITT